MTPRALTIAGSDSGGGAGVQADLKTFTVFGVYGMSVVTAITAQNTAKVRGVHLVPPGFVQAQLDAVLSDIGTDATKTGMLPTAAIVTTVAQVARERRLDKLVVDPVFCAGNGTPLVEPATIDAVRAELMPLALVITPNRTEAETLAGIKVDSITGMREAARILIREGARGVLVKGGHFDGDEAVDIFDDGRAVQELRSGRIATRHTHGTGCQLSAAITAGLASGLPLSEALIQAKRFISLAIANSVAIGKGNGPANPLAWLEPKFR